MVGHSFAAADSTAAGRKDDAEAETHDTLQRQRHHVSLGDDGDAIDEYDNDNGNLAPSRNLNPLLESLMNHPTTHVRKRSHNQAPLSTVGGSATPTRSPLAAATGTLTLSDIEEHGNQAESVRQRSSPSRCNSNASSGTHGSIITATTLHAAPNEQRLLERNSDDDEESTTRERTCFCIVRRRFYIDTLRAVTSGLGLLVPPFWFRWLHAYSWRKYGMSDVLAGVTVGVMIVPQSMSYAKLAGLPVQWGLYSALTPVLVYALYGTSRQLAVGPVALLSLLLSTGLSNLLQDYQSLSSAEEYQRLYQTLAIQCSFLVGLVYIVAGQANLGRILTMFLSHAVISGFTTGAAVIIGLSQVKYIVGYDIGKSDKVPDVIAQLLQGIHQFNVKTFIMGMASIALLLGAKHAGTVAPSNWKWIRAVGPLVLTIVSIVLTVVFNLHQHGIPVVGPIPRGFPSSTVHEWWSSWPSSESSDTTSFSSTGLLTLVVSMAMIGFMESIAIAQQLAVKHGYEIDASKELIGLGMANVMGSAFNAFPIAGSFSRTAVNNASGATSAISGMATACLVCIALVCLTPVFEKLPLNALAAIVISGVIGLVDYEEALHLWKVHKIDCATWGLACFGTMLLGCEVGLGIAVATSVLLVVYESAQPEIDVLDRIPSFDMVPSTSANPEPSTRSTSLSGTIIVRVVGSLFFANATTIEDVVHRRMQEDDTATTVHAVILDLSAVNHTDSAGLHQIEHLWKSCRSRDQELYVVGTTSGRIMTRVALSGLVQTIGSNYFVESISAAVSSHIQNAVV